MSCSGGKWGRWGALNAGIAYPHPTPPIWWLSYNSGFYVVHHHRQHHRTLVNEFLSPPYLCWDACSYTALRTSLARPLESQRGTCSPPITPLSSQTFAAICIITLSSFWTLIWLVPPPPYPKNISTHARSPPLPFTKIGFLGHFWSYNCTTAITLRHSSHHDWDYPLH